VAVSTFSIQTNMNNPSPWLTAPADTYLLWQQTEAAGADRRPFAERSITQHVAMFDRFLRHVIAHKANLATFSATHLEAFFADVDNRCAPGTTTRLRYIKLIDRLCRHLVEIGVRRANPAADYARMEAWPEDEPEPLFLDVEADARLQEYVQPQPDDELRDTRNRAIVALLIGTGITSAEIRGAAISDLITDGPRPEMRVPKRPARDERRIPLPTFALVPLALYQASLSVDEANALLFPAPRTGKSMSDMFLHKIVRPALEAIDFRAPDMSPRVLRNTYARRLLLAGHTNEEVSKVLGLSSERTVVRLRATIPPRPTEPSD
jgi:site-specific recombinase XerD